VALALIFWLYRDLDFGRFLTGLRDAHVGWIAMLAFTILLEQVVNGWKWCQILHDVKPVRTLPSLSAPTASVLPSADRLTEAPNPSLPSVLLAFT
jgi:hypothetical protein